MPHLDDHHSADDRSTTRPTTFAYQPALDGVRAVSVALVVLFHAGVPFLPAGYLGVSVFFTLSGFLITSLLLAEESRTSTIRVASFYGRRMKRLLPASTLCLAGVVIAHAFGAFDGTPSLRRDVVGAVLELFNWVRLSGTGSYGELFASSASPLEHFWSLSIEEQFYWLWPALMLLALRRLHSRSTRRTMRRLVRLLVTATVVTSISSLVIAQVWGPDAAYWATPARLPEILVGASLAAWLHGRTVPTGAARIAAPALAAIVALSMLLPSDHGLAYEGGLPLVALVSGTLILALQVDGPLRRALAWRPIVAVGSVSYGLYLFHWPVFVVLRDAGWQLTRLPDLIGALAITAAMATASYRWVERPVRRSSWRPLPTLRLAAATTAAVLVATLTLAPATPAIRADDELLDAAAIEPVEGDLAPLSSADAPSTTTVVTSASVGDGGPDGPTSAASSGGATATSTTSASSTQVADAVTTTTEQPVALALDGVPPRPVRILVVGDSTALYVGQGLAAWSAAAPEYAQVSVTWCQGCTFVLDAEVASFDLDGVLENSRHAFTEALPQAIDDLRPDVVVLMTTVSEAADRRWPGDASPRRPSDPEFVRRTEDAYADLTMSIIRRGVPDVVWVVPPTPNHLWNDPEMNEIDRYHRHHDRIRAAADRFDTHVSVVDLDAWAEATGRADDPGWRADGVHIDVEPATDLATAFLGPWLVREALAP